MKRFIVKFLIFSALLITTYNSTHYLLFRYFKETVYKTSAFKWVEKLDPAPRLVLMGSSTMKYHISPRIVSRIYNYKAGEVINTAEDAKTPIQNYYMYKSIEGFIKPDSVVVYGIDPWIFSKDFSYIDPVIINQLSVNERLFLMKKKKENRHWHLLGGDFLHYIRRGFKKNKTNYVIPSDFGSKGLHYPLPTVHYKKDFFYFNWLGYSEIQFKYLKKLKDDVESRGGEFVILIPPKCRRWVEDYCKYSAVADKKFIAMMNRLVGKVKIIGSFYTMKDGKDNDLFKDSVHLNDVGRDIYSKRFATFLKNMKNVKSKKMQPLNTYR